MKNPTFISYKRLLYLVGTAVVAALLLVSPMTVLANGGGDLRAAVQNPISSLVSLPFKLSFDYGAANGD
jgi:hypothetical protein